MPTLKSIPIAVSLLLAACAQSAFAQAAPVAQSAPLPHPSDTMVVLGSPFSVLRHESSASVVVLPVEDKALLLESPQELLRQDSSVFLEQRGAGGGQVDLVLRGGTFEQALVDRKSTRLNSSHLGISYA